jgi:MmyB-like transcription regulator ligand binding domain
MRPLREAALRSCLQPQRREGGVYRAMARGCSATGPLATTFAAVRGRTTSALTIARASMTAPALSDAPMRGASRSEPCSVVEPAAAKTATRLVAQLRSEAGRHPYDHGRRISSASCRAQRRAPHTMGGAHNVRFHRSGVKRIRHPVVGELELTTRRRSSRPTPSSPSTSRRRSPVSGHNKRSTCLPAGLSRPSARRREHGPQHPRRIHLRAEPIDLAVNNRVTRG